MSVACRCGGEQGLRHTTGFAEGSDTNGIAREKSLCGGMYRKAQETRVYTEEINSEAEDSLEGWAASSKVANETPS